MTLFDVTVERPEYGYYRYDAENAPPAEKLFDVARVPNELTNRGSASEAEDTLKQSQALYDKFPLHWSEDCVDCQHDTDGRRFLGRRTCRVPNDNCNSGVKISGSHEENDQEVMRKASGGKKSPSHLIATALHSFD